MFRRLTFIAVISAAAIGCSSGSSGPDAAGAADTGTIPPDAGTIPPDAGSIPPDAGADSGVPADAGACIPGLGSCSPCPGFTGNDAGLGAYCTQGGGECVTGLYCPADFGQAQNFCISAGVCNGDAGTGCGPGECCSIQQNPLGGTVAVCFPTGCNSCP